MLVIFSFIKLDNFVANLLFKKLKRENPPFLVLIKSPSELI